MKRQKPVSEIVVMFSLFILPVVDVILGVSQSESLMMMMSKNEKIKDYPFAISK